MELGKCSHPPPPPPLNRSCNSKDRQCNGQNKMENTTPTSKDRH